MTLFPETKQIQVRTRMEDHHEKALMTWGLHRIGIHRTTHTGKGVNVALLDTGICQDHPDFKDRGIKTISLVPNETVHDGNGHGTHCAGIAFGALHPEKGPRYSVAPHVNLHVAKVLPDSGTVHSRLVRQGIEWAIENDCRVISISLGNRVRFGETHPPSFERLGQKALDRGAMIICPAGNDSHRHVGRILPVSRPANCPSFIAVGAVDRQNNMYSRCNRSINTNGGIIDFSAPGVGIHSAWPTPDNYRSQDGTSMAASFFSGIAALWIQAFPNLGIKQLIEKMRRAAKAINLPEQDTGAGLAQAPQ